MWYVCTSTALKYRHLHQPLQVHIGHNQQAPCSAHTRRCSSLIALDPTHVSSPVTPASQETLVGHQLSDRAGPPLGLKNKPPCLLTDIWGTAVFGLKLALISVTVVRGITGSRSEFTLCFSPWRGGHQGRQKPPQALPSPLIGFLHLRCPLSSMA